MPVLVRLERQVILIMPYRIILCSVYFAINQPPHRDIRDTPLAMQVGMYLARHFSASLVLYITDMPTTAAWLDHVYGSYSGAGEAFRDEGVQTAVREVVASHLPGETQLLKWVTNCVDSVDISHCI